jgi:hypothetical protein
VENGDRADSARSANKEFIVYYRFHVLGIIDTIERFEVASAAALAAISKINNGSTPRGHDDRLRTGRWPAAFDAVPDKMASRPTLIGRLGTGAVYGNPMASARTIKDGAPRQDRPRRDPHHAKARSMSFRVFSGIISVTFAAAGNGESAIMDLNSISWRARRDSNPRPPDS